MQLTVIDQGTISTHAAKNGMMYQSITITYKDDKGLVSSKKLMSFANRKLFEASQKWSSGTVVDVKEGIDSKGFNVWLSYDVKNVDQDIADIDSDIPF